MPQENAAADDFADDADSLEWQQKFEARQRKIRQAPNVQNELGTLAERGANEAKVLGLLALVVLEDAEFTVEFLKSRQKQLTSLADKFERISEEVTAAFSNPFNSSAFVGFGYLREIVNEFPSKEDLERNSTAARNRIAPILKLLRAEAKEFGRMARIYSPLKRDHALGRLLRHVKESTGQFHDDNMANLLQAAHDALGVDATFSAEQLRKMRMRNFPSLVRNRSKSWFAVDTSGMLRPFLSELDKTEGEN